MSQRYHYSGSKASVNLDEPLFLTKFVSTFVLPPILQAKYGNAIILSEQILEIGGLKTEDLPAMSEQGFRGIKRMFVGTVPEAGGIQTLTMKYEVNVDKNGIIYPYNIFRDWSRLEYDPQTGLQTLKKDHVGQLTIEIHNKVGTVLKKFFSPTVFVNVAPNEMALNYMSEGQYQLDTGVIAENWTDVIIGD
jgi:hypothetical protein